MKQLNSFLKQLTWREGLELLFYPVVLIFRMPVAWVKSLWESRVLLDGQWSRYMGFNPRNALNGFFYRSQWLNIDRHGRAGVSPNIGLGDYPLSRWFHLSNLSSYFYANAGAVTTLFGTLVWVFSHLIWIEVTDPVWVVVVTLTLFFSSTAFSIAFARQNYNILGWMWLPIALFAVMTGHWVIAAMAWFAASLASFTVIFVAVPLMTVYAIELGALEPIWVLIPAISKLGLHLRPMIVSGGFWAAVRSMAKAIGFGERGGRYFRHHYSNKTLKLFYFVALYSLSCIVPWWLEGNIPVLPLAALVLYFVNQVLVRFADDQSMLILFVSVFAAHLMSSDPSAVNWALLWCAASPMPILLGISRPSLEGIMFVPPQRPFDHSELMAQASSFLSPVPDGEKVLFSFNDPSNKYQKIFDGYRVCLELPLLVAGHRGIHLFPDWWAVFETNYDGAPTFWGRSIPEVLENMTKWKASYVITYLSLSDDALGNEWLDHFEIISQLDWNRWLEKFDGFVPWPADIPPLKTMLLLRKKTRQTTLKALL